MISQTATISTPDEIFWTDKTEIKVSERHAALLRRRFPGP
jgi:hypothetical protein